MTESTTGEKEFQPSEQKKKRALEDGDTLYVPQINTGILLCLFIFATGLIIKFLFLIYNKIFSNIFILYANKHKDLFAIITNTLLLFCLFLFIILIILALVSFIISIIQLKGFRIIPFKIKVESLNIVENIKQKFSIKIMIKLIIEVCFTLVLLIVEIFVVKEFFNDIVKLLYVNEYNQIAFSKFLLFRMIIVALVLFAIFLLVYYVIEKYFYIKKLMMTKEEVEKEIENNEGKREVKSRTRDARIELLEEDDFLNNIINTYGSFVISNPTHYAVLIFYAADSLPIVLLKGKNEVAQRIIFNAKKSGLPVIRNIYIARLLFDLCSPGEYIPKSMIKDIGKLIGINLYVIKPFIREVSVLRKESLLQKKWG